MDARLHYLIILRPNGLPLYAQSFDFDSDFACQSFNTRIDQKEIDEKRYMLGSYLSVIKDMVAEVFIEKLKIVSLEFESYQIVGLNNDGFLFLGIFSYEDSIVVGQIYKTMGDIVTAFNSRYDAKHDYQVGLINIEKYEKFTEELERMEVPLKLHQCRNCLQKCADENKNCLPHLIYYNITAKEKT